MGCRRTQPSSTASGTTPVAVRGVVRLVELSHPVVEAAVYDAPAGTALILANFTYR